MLKARKRPPRTAGKRFPPAVCATLSDARFVWLRAGAESEHRFTGVWVVVVERRVFVRSWYMRPDGWFHAFRRDPRGAVRLKERGVPVRATLVRSARLKDAVSQAYADKYTTPASIQYVRGFARGRRRETTTEIRPG